jgi:hypothetical protein
VNRSDVDDPFPGCVRKTAPRKTDQTKYNQDHPKRFVHGGLLWRWWLKAVTEQSDHYLQAELCALRSEPVHLLLEYLFNLADFLLDFAAEFFVLAFGFQVGVVRDLSGFLFDVAFQFMKLAFDLIFRARFHLVPLFFRELSTKAVSGVR